MFRIDAVKQFYQNAAHRNTSLFSIDSSLLSENAVR